MKLTVNRNAFRVAYRDAASVFPYSPRSLVSVQLAPRDGHVLLTSSYQERVVQAKVEAQCDKGPTVWLPWRVGAAVSRMNSEDITLELIDKSVDISGGMARITLRTSSLSNEDPEQLQLAIDERHVEIGSRLFRRAVRSTEFATLTFVKLNRLTLQCVNVAVSNSKMTFTATDGTRVSQFVADVNTKDSEYEYGRLLIEPHFLRDLSSFARYSTVKMCVKDDSFAVFGFGDSIFATVPLASGLFPKMDAVFNTFDREADHYETVRLKVADLAALLSRTAVVSTSDHQVVRLFIAKHRLWSEMRTPEVGEARSSIDVASWANSKPVTLDVQLLRDGLATLNHKERVLLSIPDDALPLKLFDDNFTYVVMPFANDAQQQHAYGDAIATKH